MIRINVGGKKTFVLENSIKLFPNSLLNKIIYHKDYQHLDEEGNIMIDYDWESFRWILKIYRIGIIPDSIHNHLLPEEIHYWFPELFLKNHKEQEDIDAENLAEFILNHDEYEFLVFRDLVSDHKILINNYKFNSELITIFKDELELVEICQMIKGAIDYGFLKDILPNDLVCIFNDYEQNIFKERIMEYKNYLLEKGKDYFLEKILNYYIPLSGSSFFFKLVEILQQRYNYEVYWKTINGRHNHNKLVFLKTANNKFQKDYYHWNQSQIHSTMGYFQVTLKTKKDHLEELSSTSRSISGTLKNIEQLLPVSNKDEVEEDDY